MKRGYIFIMMALLTFVGCSKSEDVDSSQSGELRITSEILTRASGQVWGKGDKIGVYMTESGTTTYLGVENTIYYTTSESSNVNFTSDNPLYYPATGYVDILAYYPHSDAEEFDITAYEVDVTDQSDLTAIDLMIASKSGIASTSEAVALNFEHKLSQINLTIKLSDGTDLDLTKMSMTISSISATATYDLTSSTLDDLGVKTKVEIDCTVDNDNTVATAEAIMIPQTLSDAKLMFTFESGEVLSAPFSTATFAAGQSYNYTATLSYAAVKLSSATIGDWGDGGSDDTLSATLVGYGV